MNLFILMLLSFLLGSIPVGLLIARAKGIDLRNRGSGNIGATNVMRTVGTREALITLIGDIAKGTIPVIAAWYVFPDATRVGLVGVSAVAGHDFSVFLKLKGGKGVATSLGVLLAYAPPVGLITAAIWITVFLFSRTSSLSALIAFTMLPLTMFFIDNAEGKFLISLILTVLIIIKHKDNIRRLRTGQEFRMGQKA